MAALLKREKKVSEQTASLIVKHLLIGLKFLHDRKIIHRDLKLSNLFIDNDFKVRIGNFGNAIVVEDMEARMKEKCGSDAYQAPEMFFSDQPRVDGYNHKVDIWSVGVITALLLTGEHPFIHSYSIESKWREQFAKKYPCKQQS